jgi:uncharacterized protein (TIGR02646 family)
MRYLVKLEEPPVLAENKGNWLAEFKADRNNATRKFRYRDSSIKTQLKRETGYKCIYCESKIGHNTPGDVEHIIPSSKDEDQHFEWINLSIACTECNRRKNDYYVEGEEFLNPYIDEDIEDLVEHLGPILNWRTGNNRAEITIRILELNTRSRSELIFRKIEKIEGVITLAERFSSEQNHSLKKLLELQLQEMSGKESEFSGMVKSMLIQKGLPN